jgi:hypothetical protein
MPPSGPTTRTISVFGGRTDATAMDAPSCSTYAAGAAASRAATWAVVASGAITGIRQPPGLLGGFPRHCLPPGERLLAAFARPPHDRARRLPGDDLVDADLGEQVHRLLGALVLREAWTQTIRGVGRAAARSSATWMSSPSLRTATTGPRTPRPSPLVTVTTSPRPILRTTAAWRPSGPPSVTTEPIWTRSSSAATKKPSLTR